MPSAPCPSTARAAAWGPGPPSHLDRLIAGGGNLLMFAEGTRSHDGAVVAAALGRRGPGRHARPADRPDLRGRHR
ncbi:MAG: hypothetical protein WKF40_00760 [Thermoleophilaceae bacterium]